jgi:hypothetical protein
MGTVGRAMDPMRLLGRDGVERAKKCDGSGAIYTCPGANRLERGWYVAAPDDRLIAVQAKGSISECSGDSAS